MLITTLATAGWKRATGWSESAVPPEKRVVKSDSSGVFIRASVYGLVEEDTTIDRVDYKIITIPEEHVVQMSSGNDTLIVGKPQIPYIRLMVAVPDSASFNITVDESEYSLLQDYLLYPVPQVVFEDSGVLVLYKEIFTYDTSFYDTDTLYPGKFYELSNDGHWRDQRVLEIFLYPVQYSVKQRSVYFYYGLDLTIEYADTVVENENGLGPCEEIGREELLNYPGVEREPESVPEPAVHYYSDLLDTSNTADYIIVTHEDFLESSTDSTAIHEFAQWRVDHSKLDVGIVEIQDVYSQFTIWHPDSASQLRHFLIYAYDNWRAPSMSDGHFAYSLFIGDWDYVPIERCTVDYNIPNVDPDRYMNAYEGFFRDIDSEELDQIDDIMLGRWPVKTTQSETLITITQKTIDYEKNPDTTGRWRRQGLLIAGRAHDAGEYHMFCDFPVSQSAVYFTDISYDTLTVRYGLLPDPSYFPDTLHKLLDLGEIIAAHYGHGGFNCWGGGYNTAFAETLANATRLPVVLSYACVAGSFQWDHPHYRRYFSGYPAADRICLGECLLANPDGGAVAWYGGASPLYMNTYSTIPMRRMLREQQWVLGKSLINVPLRCDNDSGNCYCLLGDPALDLGDYTAYPDLADLVIRPRGMDISLLSPYPYPRNGDSIPVRAKILNIGATAAQNIDINFVVTLDEDTIYDTTTAISELQPRDSAVVTVYWNTEHTHANYYGEIGDCDFIVTADPDKQIKESWEYNNKSLIDEKVVLYPYLSGWPKPVTGFSQPAIADIDNADSVEIIYACHDSIYVFNANGSRYSPWPKYFEEVLSFALGDIDDNGFIDIIAVSPTSVTAYDYQGNVLSGWPQQIPYVDTSFCGYPALGRITGGTKLQVIIFAGTRCSTPVQSMIFVYDYNGDPLYTFSTSSTTYRSLSKGPAISDVNGDGDEEIVVSYDRGVPLGGTENMRTDIFNRYGLQASLGSGSGYMIPALVDLDDPPDGYAEMILGCSDDTVRAYKPASGDTLWKTNTGGEIKSSPAVGNINPVLSGFEVTLGNDSMEIWAMRGEYGTPWGLWPLEVDGCVRSSAALAQIDTIQGLEIVIGSYDFYTYALDHNRESISPYPLPLFSMPTSPIVGDLDGDGKSEVILSGDGYLHVWTNADSVVSPYLLEWPQFHHDYQRTGLYGW